MFQLVCSLAAVQPVASIPQPTFFYPVSRFTSHSHNSEGRGSPHGGKQKREGGLFVFSLQLRKARWFCGLRDSNAWHSFRGDQRPLVVISGLSGLSMVEIEAQLVTMQISHVLLQDTMVERVRHIRKYEHRRAETATSLTLHVGHGFGVNTSRYLVMNPFWASVKTCGAWFFVSLVIRSQHPVKEWKSNWIPIDSDLNSTSITSRLSNLSGTAILPDAQNPQTWKRDENPQKFSGLKTHHGLLWTVCNEIILLDDWMVTFHIKWHEQIRWSHFLSVKNSQPSVIVKAEGKFKSRVESGRYLAGGPEDCLKHVVLLALLRQMVCTSHLGHWCHLFPKKWFCTLPETNNSHLKTFPFLGWHQPGRVRTVSC